MSIVSALDKNNHLSEFNVLLQTNSGFLTPTQRKALVRANIGAAASSGGSLTNPTITGGTMSGTAISGGSISGALIDNSIIGSITPAAGTFTTVTSVSFNISGLTANSAVATDASKNLVSVPNTGTGNNVLATSPTLVTPNLGTPSAVNLANGTNLPVSTGISGLATGMADFLATPTSANLKATVTDETGSGALVFATSPTLVTPALGTPASGVLTNCTGLPLSTGISGLATGMATFLATPTSANLAATVTDETGTGALVFANSPALSSPSMTTPNIGVATATSVNKVAITAPTTSATLTIADGTTLTETSSTSIGRGQYLATNTNDNATAGNIGEYIFSELASGSAIGISNGVNANVTTISLTAGDWDVWGNVSFVPAGGTTQSAAIVCINTVSATRPTPPAGGGFTQISASFQLAQGQSIPAGPMRMSLSATTTVYLIAFANFSGSTMSAFGGIYARRVR